MQQKWGKLWPQPPFCCLDIYSTLYFTYFSLWCKWLLAIQKLQCLFNRMHNTCDPNAALRYEPLTWLRKNKFLFFQLVSMIVIPFALVNTKNMAHHMFQKVFDIVVVEPWFENYHYVIVKRGLDVNVKRGLDVHPSTSL
jgi:hypothetical protein